MSDDPKIASVSVVKENKPVSSSWRPAPGNADNLYMFQRWGWGPGFVVGFLIGIALAFATFWFVWRLLHFI